MRQRPESRDTGPAGRGEMGRAEEHPLPAPSAGPVHVHSLRAVFSNHVKGPPFHSPHPALHSTGPPQGPSELADRACTGLSCHGPSIHSGDRFLPRGKALKGAPSTPGSPSSPSQLITTATAHAHSPAGPRATGARVQTPVQLPPPPSRRQPPAPMKALLPHSPPSRDLKRHTPAFSHYWSVLLSLFPINCIIRCELSVLGFSPSERRVRLFLQQQLSSPLLLRELHCGLCHGPRGHSPADGHFQHAHVLATATTARGHSQTHLREVPRLQFSWAEA